ncbi:GNAT family N-acetyltransferase [Micropruina sonneratiae]|uniref:GNAT family N-acetyltransferase n=1 Tax=Micropruina sonneratiae TaxID=2986940 RepID=UPI002225CA2D|nr:GNAT family N-acetyltransferase [Micropruina sp. KQZ13P-5]MCW3157323.1 GNAT family N-acetyltransferase [Micropruina sp. KQZ13P-5]
MIADSVRLALPVEAEQIAAVQRRSWTQQFPSEVADSVLGTVDLASMTASWQGAIQRPPLAQFRVLVAVADSRVVGFAAVGPSDDPDAEPGADGMVAEFTVDPQAQRSGHGSRLLNACVDTLRADGFVRASWWVRSTDDVLRRFLTEAGWGADGGHQEVGSDDDTTRLKLVRLHTDISG